jgi:hypothetical protein
MSATAKATSREDSLTGLNRKIQETSLEAQQRTMAADKLAQDQFLAPGTKFDISEPIALEGDFGLVDALPERAKSE